MRKTLLLLSMFFVLLASAAAFAGAQDFVLVNKTGVEINAVYVSPSKSNDWEEDILGDDVLENGQNVRINIDDGSGACIYDFKAEFTNGQELTRSRINVCEVSEYTYTR